MDEATEKMLNEWRSSMENARHFNDLLIRFRMLGLPMVITLAVAGIGSSGFVGKIELWAWAIPLLTLALSLIGLAALFWHTIQKLMYFHRKKINRNELEEKQQPPLPIYWLEFSTWVVFLSVLSGFTVIDFHNLINSQKPFFQATAHYSITPIALIAAVTLLAALYLMDRFYYYRLLMGAVSRLASLEESLQFRITQTTSEFIPRKHATNLISFFYCVPGIVLLVIACVSFNL